MKLHRFSWIFTSCPDQEIPYLFNYEFSRESVQLRERVEFIRHGQFEGPTYWTPSPEFGWPQWPFEPYLSIPPRERARLLETLFQQQTQAERSLLALRSSLFQLEGPKLPEIFSALSGAPFSNPRETKAVGRAALKAKHHNELRSLAVFRLRAHYSAREALRLYNNVYGQTYSNVDALEKAKRKARRYLLAFVLKTEANAALGFWFPPFGPSLTHPS